MSENEQDILKVGEPSEAPSFTQVYRATHDDDKLLPYYRRSFISFSYGGKNIEDFNLIATIQNNSLDRKMYGEFTDNVTESEIWDGQLYWSSHFQKNEISFTLATDSMTEENMSQFKYWFQPGKIRELILAENPNRAILARVAEPPTYSMLPFGTTITKILNKKEYEFQVTEYKGTIELHLVMDDPFWYSRTNILCPKIVEATETTPKYNVWVDNLDNPTITYSEEDGLKVLFEDNIPISEAINTAPDNTENMFYGDETNYIIDKSMSYTGSRIALNSAAEIKNILNQDGSLKDYKDIGATIGAYTDSAIVDTSIIMDEALGGHVYPVFKEQDSVYPSISNLRSGYFYYGGTAPSAPIISFTYTPGIMNSDEGGYINVPANSYSSPDTPYNTIAFKSMSESVLKLTTPSLYTGYNQVVEILNNDAYLESSREDICDLIRLKVKHYVPRKIAIGVISNDWNDGVNLTKELVATIKDDFSSYFHELNTSEDDESAEQTLGNFYPVICEINNQTGQVIIITSVRFPGQDEPQLIVENAGDMICSNYIKLTDTNVLDENGQAQIWSESHPNYSYKMSSNMTLYNVGIRYKFLYL